MIDQLGMDKMRGEVTLSLFHKDGTLKERIVVHNDIMPMAKEIAAKRLIGHPTSVIDQISLYLNNNLVATETIAIVDTAIITATQVSFSVLFSQTSFTGPVNAAQLIASGIGPFSYTFVNVNKSANESLSVTWKIQIS